MNNLFKYFHKLLPTIAFGLLMLSFPVLEGCRKPSDPNPCDTLRPTSADFRIEQKLDGVYEIEGKRYGEKTFSVDTVLAGQYVYFTANQDLDFYEWRIGNDPRRWNTKSVRLLFFDSELKDTINIPITLKGRKKPNKSCFPMDTGEEIITKVLVIVPSQSIALLGDFKGSDLENPSNDYTISLKSNDVQDVGGYLLRINNLPNGCAYYISPRFLYKRASLTPNYDLYCNSGYEYGCNCIRGWVDMSRNKDTINILYEIKDNNNQYVKRTFKGIRKK